MTSPRAVQDLAERFAEQCARTPNRPAVVFGDRQLTYQELDTFAEGYADVLVHRGLVPGTPVALSIDRSLELVVAIVAVVKAGGGYLPLHAGYPMAWRHQVLRDAGAAAVMTDRASVSARPGRSFQLPVVTVDLDRPTRSPSGGRHSQTCTSPDDLACLMYTSGSTGRPRGVAVTRTDVLGFARSPEWRGGRHRRVLLHSPTAFDASTYELWVPLLNGGCVVVAPPGHLGPTDLQDVIRGQGVTALFVTSGLFATIAVELPECFSTVSELWTGGDVVPIGAVRRVAAHCPNTRIVNVYGPTECTTFATAYRVTELATLERSVPIGAAITGKRAYVLDAMLRPVDMGDRGELYLGGRGVTRGYWRDPASTARSFLPDPFGPPGARMYRTGDVVRRLPGGLDYVGRVDTQVKLRGHRVEPAEVECVINEHPSVGQAAVIVHETPAGSRQLVAYVVPAAGRIAPSSLRSYLASRLPAYLVPSRLVTLDRMPLTANGKPNRQALPEPGAPARTSADPTTATERALAELVGELLTVTGTSLDVNLFELGADSLLAMRLVGRIRTRLGVEIDLDEIFTHPTVRELARRIDGNEQCGQRRPPLVAGPIPESFPLSSAQLGIWLSQQLAGDRPIYNEAWVVPLDDVDVDALRMALGDVIRQHSSLRTLITGDDEPRQHCLDTVDDPLEIVRTRSAAALVELAGRPFDLSSQVPFRATLVRGADDDVLLITCHHIAVDGWSMRIVFADLGAAYRARTRGRDPSWPAAKVHPAHYTSWHAALLGDPADNHSLLATQLAYWRRRLAGAPAELSLPVDRRRPARASFAGDTATTVLDASLHQGLLDLARGTGCTLFMVLHAGLVALLGRLGAGTDLVIGTPVAGRSDEKLHGLVGFFANTLPLRTDTSGDPTWRELVSRVASSDAEAFAHADVPFEQLVRLVDPGRSASRHPLFQVMLVLQNTPAAPQETMPGLAAGAIERVAVPTARFDLLFDVTERRSRDGEPNGLVVRLEYRTDMFDHSTVEALLEQLATLLRSASRNPDRRLSAATVGGHNRVEHRQGPTSFDVVARFRRQVTDTPTGTAIVADEQSLTYAELDRRVAQLAGRLHAAGVGPEDVVAVRMTHSVDLVVAMIAVLAIGAAYLPIDPGLSSVRAERILADARPTVTLDGAPHPDPSHLARPPTRRASPDHPAYILYTSGSTGRPKGVVMTYRALANLVSWQLTAEPVGRRVAQLTPSGFDVSLQEVLGTLTHGGTLVIPSEPDRKDSEALVDWLDRHRVDQVFAPTPVLEEIAAAAADLGTSLPQLRSLVQAGETLVIGTTLRDFCALVPGRMLRNSYGPTETHVVTTLLLPGPAATWPAKPTIGTPLPGTEVRILDERLAPVPTGVVGELYVCGVQLARGYLGQPGQTAERFLPDPLGLPGSRMYRTGDLARWSRDSELEFHGRRDQQVKIHGVRVEPAETEAALIEHPGVHRAVVSAEQSRNGTMTLTAYVVPNGQLDATALQAFLAERLPPAFLPASFVQTSRIPATPNGKVDRASLARSHQQIARRPVLGDSETVNELTTLVAKCLRLPPDEVRPQDSFFALGGHSLVAVRLANLIRERMRVDLSVQEVFQQPTIAALAVTLDRPAAKRVDFLADAVLPEVVTTAGLPPCELPAAPATALLTGATGFLGAFLLDQLARRTNARLCCLVRAADDAQAWQRLRDNLVGYGLWRDELGDRLVPIAGDLAAPVLGLSAERFGWLSKHVDVIYHNAARVSAVDSYRRLRPANVHGTVELLRLAATTRIKPVHFVSTSGVAVPDGRLRTGPLPEERADPHLLSDNGYLQSKWVGEELVRAACARGVPAAVYRPGRIAGHTATGASGRDDGFWNLVRAMVVIGAVPSPDDLADVAGHQPEADLVPVDHVATSIVGLSQTAGFVGRTYHLTCTRPARLADIVVLLRRRGHPLRTLPHRQWRARLRAMAGRSGAQLDVAALLDDALPELVMGGGARFSRRNADAGLRTETVPPADVDAELIDRCLEYFTDTGFLPAPRS